MKALFTLKPAIEKSILSVALLSVVFIAYPASTIVAANNQAEGQSALIFEIKDPSLIANSLNSNPTLSYDQIVENDPLVAKLQAYLEDYNSPLAQYASEIVKQPQWQRALAISWVESNFGRRCADNNCSGIGVEPGHPAWRRYQTKLDWFKDMCQLLEKPIYKERFTTFEKMRGIYVYPGSPAWVNGAKSKYAELMELEKQALEEKLAMQDNGPVATASISQELAQLTK